MQLRYVIPGVVLAVLAAAAIGWNHVGRDQQQAVVPSAPVLLAAPVGVTFQELRAAFSENDERNAKMQLILADARGHTIYFNDKDSGSASVCDATCGEKWKPLPVMGETSGIVPTWSVVNRADGTKQWALRGKPLYTFTGDSRIGEIKGDKTDGVWNVALFNSVTDIVTPYGFGVLQKVNAAAETLVNGTGMTLYWSVATPAGPRCYPDTCTTWVPVVAGALDRPVGDFSLVKYDVGIPQWAYKGHPLFTYTGDKEVGDVHGARIDLAMQVAKTARYYTPPNMDIRHNMFGGVNITTSEGMVLYLRNRQMPPQGHSLRAGIRGDARIGRALGIRGCEGDCLKERPLVPAPADAIPAGYWDTATRPDGTRQWAYRGFPLYTFTGDKKPGDMIGNEIYDIDPPNAPVDVGMASPAGVGFVSWIAVVP